MSKAFVFATKKATSQIVRSGTINRLLSMTGGSTGEDDKAFYALGINIARQVGGDLKGLLSKDEIASVLSGFSDSLLDKAGDEVKLLQEYGPKLNEILAVRAASVVQVEKQKGDDFRTKYLLSNPRAIQTSSGNES